jgi:hypothetical protein
MNNFNIDKNMFYFFSFQKWSTPLVQKSCVLAIKKNHTLLNQIAIEKVLYWICIQVYGSKFLTITFNQ